MAFLEVENLRKKFGENEVLKGISFSLERGEVLSVIGASGNGKTTLLRCLNFLETLDAGTISVDGKRICSAENEKCGSTFGLVFQNFNLFPQYDVMRNITLPMDMALKRRLKRTKCGFIEKRKAYKDGKKQNEQKAEELLESVGLNDKAHNYPFELSGGQSQRAAIARALALSPDILCFDEPTSALDPELTVEIMKVITDLRRSNKTMIVVTHDTELAKNVSDKVMFMRDGIAERFGTPESLFENPDSEALARFLKNSLDY